MFSNIYEDSNLWLRLERQSFHISEFFRYYRDKVQVAPGLVIDYFYVERPRSATIVAQTDNGEIAMLRQYRYPVHAWCWELPAGAFIAGKDQDLQDTAKRELHEETGIICQTLEEIGHFYVASHLTNEATYVFIGTIKEIAESHVEVSETLSLQFVPVARALDMVHRGEIHDGPSALALLLAETRLISAR
jgi:ADP-ribose pyrophosphatase